MKEIEILVELYSNIDDCKNELNKKYNYEGTKLTIDEYYYDPLRKNLKPNKNNQIDECLRLRSKDDTYYITYKVDRFEGKKWLYSDEYETKIDDITQLHKIIELLGLKHLITIHNNKSIYKSDKYEITIEEVKDLGNFMEVEYCTNEEVDIKQIKNEINIFIKNLGFDVSNELNIGKPEMMINKNNIKITD